MPKEIAIDQYSYDLPEEQIAQFAAEPRDSSKLLFYNGGQISDHSFFKLDTLLPDDSVLFFNNAKVIPARVYCKNSNGAEIEIFILQPFEKDHLTALSDHGKSLWICMVGNKKKWKENEVLKLEIWNLEVLISRVDDAIVCFEWSSSDIFADLLEKIGRLPLPPYIKHEATGLDEEHYQTVYSRVQGSVAAPTAGLHFSDSVLSRIKDRGIGMEFLTLHVGAGTFLPVKVANAREHNMHKEFFSIDFKTVEALKKEKRILPVGTTACRVLESLYWVAVKLLNGSDDALSIQQFEYEKTRNLPSREQAVEALLEYMIGEKLETLDGETSIMLAPGYHFRMTGGLITNFHQPKSTLLLLISALIGDAWKTVYEHAKANEYRFLSFGDSSLLLP